MLKTKTTKISDLHEGERFDVVCQTLFKELSRKKIKEIIDKGGAYLNKKRISIAKYQVKVGDKIEIFWEEFEKKAGQNKEFSTKKILGITFNKNILIFDHQNFFIINKPAGIASQATLTSTQNTIIHALSLFNPVLFNEKNMYLVHRLDKETSGLMIIAKNKVTQQKFEALFHEKMVKKEYEALCLNTPKKMSGKISFALAKDNSRKNCYFAVTNPLSRAQSTAKAAETDYFVKKIFAQGELSLISCYPKTGRTHQIRVHLSAIGCPVLGDKTYAQNIHGHRFAQIALRHMLHAAHLEFEIDGEKFVFDAPRPEDFERVIKNT